VLQPFAEKFKIKTMKNFINLRPMVLCLALLFIASFGLKASSHREAPLISNDPLADNVDLYTFRSPDNPDMITIIATYVPLQLPHGGPNYYSFGENIRYEIHVDNDASIPGDEITYRFTFTVVNEDPTTFFNIRLGAQNQKTTYTLERSMDGGNTFQVIIANGVVPPNNIGPRSIQGGAGLNTTYAALFNNAITQATTGETVFAGPTDDPFFVDLGGIFDLGDAPRQGGTPKDGVACYNVSAIAIQVPISLLKKASAPAQPTSILDSDYVIGVWASASRPAITTLSSNENPTYSGDWVQVSRLGMPLTNEAVIAIGQKDFWNSITPYDEISETTMDEYFFNPELALYMDDDLFGGAVPAFSPLRIQKASLGAFDFTNGADGLFPLKGNPALAGTALDDAIFGTLLLPAPGKPRSVDLWPIFHTGVPNLAPYHLATGKGGNPLANGKPFINNFLPNGGDMLRLNMAVPPTPRNHPNFSSLGLVQAAAIGLTVAPFNTTANLEFIPNMDGFPNGRRLEDDVTRIELQAVGGVVLAAVGLWYDDYNPNDPNASPVTQDLLNVLTYTTGVEKNDKTFRGTFPYLAMPHSGTGNCSGEVVPNAPGVVSTASIFVSSNNSGVVGAYDVLNNGELQLSSFPSMGPDADGIYYDEANDVLYQLNRTGNVINAYSDVANNIANGTTPPLTATSSSDFTNGREITVMNGKLVVAQDAATTNGNLNKLLVYNASATSITLDVVYDVSINLWGIQAAGTTLFAVVDNSSNVAVFDDFFTQPAGTLMPTRTVTIEGLIRTHGLHYISAIDEMLLTDIGDAAITTDGAILSIANWSEASADDFVSSSEQIRVSGAATLLGNPVDIDVDIDGEIIYVAERATDGGRLLGFAVSSIPATGGNIAPTYNEVFAGISAVTLAGVESTPPTVDDNEDYVIIALDDIRLDRSTVHSGGVGSVASDGVADIRDQTVITAQGTFVRALDINIIGSSLVTDALEEAAVYTLPDFIYNPFDLTTNDLDVTIGTNETVVLDGDVYEDISVGKNATVIFNGQGNVYIDDLTIKEGAKVIFNQCTNLIINDEMELKKSAQFNMDQQNVNVYAEGEIKTSRRTIIYANLYTLDDLWVYNGGKAIDGAALYGTFIAEDVKAQRFANWYYQDFDRCPAPTNTPTPATSATPNNSIATDINVTGSRLDVNIYPNPVHTALHLNISSAADYNTTITIVGIDGLKLVEQVLVLNKGANTLQYDMSNSPSGIYFVLIPQADGKMISKRFVIQ
jgi:Domain of unknown function (DUF4331)/Secretion system C-terminal sorting domain